ncbi:MAG: substrate-binding domain-containing protein [Phototrophicaceae bacterium]
MLSAKRELEILDILNEQGAVSVRDLARLFDVTEVTIRRDLQRLDTQQRLRRTHGGAMPIETSGTQDPTISSVVSSDPDPDALIISPVSNQVAHTLRANAIRRQIPLIAESSPQEGALYLGPRNYEAGQALGVWAGQFLCERTTDEIVVLMMMQQNLPNASDRSTGFMDGIYETAARPRVRFVQLDGTAVYDASYQVALDAIRTEPAITAIFGINDDSLLAALHAYREVRGVGGALQLAANVGGEGNTILNLLADTDDSLIVACMALFPSIVGRMGVDAACYLMAGIDMGDAVYTPHRLFVSVNAGDAWSVERYYTRDANGWQLRPDALAELVDPRWLLAPPAPDNRVISFVIHYRTHEWYQNLTAAMQARATELGARFSAQDVKEDLAVIVRDLRHLIGKLAASTVRDGDTILLDAGSSTSHMAQYLGTHKRLTVITNSLDVLTRLKTSKGVQVMLIGGEYNPVINALVGRGAQLFLNDMRVDKAFLVAGGVTSDFGVSSVDVREAEVHRHMIASAKEVIILADHTVLGVDARYKVCDLSLVNTLITDSGIRAEQSLTLSRMGIEVMLAGQVFRQQLAKEVSSTQ